MLLQTHAPRPKDTGMRTSAGHHGVSLSKSKSSSGNKEEVSSVTNLLGSYSLSNVSLRTEKLKTIKKATCLYSEGTTKKM